MKAEDPFCCPVEFCTKAPRGNSCQEYSNTWISLLSTPVDKFTNFTEEYYGTLFEY
jgi:hypothetical protein